MLYTRPLYGKYSLTGFIVLHRFGQPITMEKYIEQFLSDDPDLHRGAVKRLTSRIERGLVQATINAPDW